LTEITQHIHSLRASGVRLDHAVSALESATSAFRRSSGTLCTTPPAISVFVFVMAAVSAKETIPAAQRATPDSEQAMALSQRHGNCPFHISYQFSTYLGRAILISRTH
jgi:hypothetical protein